MRGIIGAARIAVFLITAFATILIQRTLLCFTKGPAILVYPRWYYGFLCHVFAIRTETEGDIATGKNIVYAGNHISYLDIVVLGALVRGSFIAKKDVASWPFFGTMARLQRTLFISREAKDAAQETAMILARLDEGLPLIAFPEGTSTNGTNVLPFKSSFFHIFLNRDTHIQPFTISLLSVNGVPASNPAARDQYAWYGDMTLLPHLWAFAKGRGAVLKVSFHNPRESSTFTDRKNLSADIHASVAKGLDLRSIPA